MPCTSGQRRVEAIEIPPGFERCGVTSLTLPNYHAELEELLGSAQEGDHVYVRAYSLDSRPLIAALVSSLERGARARVLADSSQTSKTKLQLQSLKELGVAGTQVRVGKGTSLKAAYASENRRGRQHGRRIVWNPPRQECARLWAKQLRPRDRREPEP